MPANPATIAAQVKPSHGEDQPAFSIRFHESMKRLVPDTRERNRLMFQAWGDADGMAAAAEEAFPAERYRRATGCEFKSHVAQNRDGSQSVYDRDQLAAMTRNMNSRIRDTGNYGTITDGHTTDDPNTPQPPVLGHRGPYYLGQIGQTNPKWAIFSTEHATHAAADTLKSRPTRSAEVWRSPRVEDRIIEPLAALGAEAPRLDLGTVRYARTEGGEQVERYMAAAMPGAFSTHITGGRDKYAEDEPEPAMTEGLSQEGIQAISDTVVSAIMETPQWQFITSLMQSGEDPEGDGPQVDDTPAEAVGDATGAAPAPEEPSPAASGEPPAPDSPEAASPAPEPEPAPAPTPEPEPMAQSPAPEPEPAPVEEERYMDTPANGASQADQIAQLQAENARLRQQISAMQGSSAPAPEQYRRQRLMELQADGFQLDVDREMEMVGDFNDDQFERYAASFEQTRERIPLADVVGPTPRGELPQPPPTQDGTAPEMARYSKAATEYTIQRQRAGETVEFREALAIAQDPNDTRITV